MPLQRLSELVRGMKKKETFHTAVVFLLSVLLCILFAKLSVLLECKVTTAPVLNRPLLYDGIRGLCQCIHSIFHNMAMPLNNTAVHVYLKVIFCCSCTLIDKHFWYIRSFYKISLFFGLGYSNTYRWQLVQMV